MINELIEIDWMIEQTLFLIRIIVASPLQVKAKHSEVKILVFIKPQKCKSTLTLDNDKP